MWAPGAVRSRRHHSHHIITIHVISRPTPGSGWNACYCSTLYTVRRSIEGPAMKLRRSFPPTVTTEPSVTTEPTVTTEPIIVTTDPTVTTDPSPSWQRRFVLFGAGFVGAAALPGWRVGVGWLVLAAVTAAAVGLAGLG